MKYLRHTDLDPRPLIGGDDETFTYAPTMIEFRPTPPHRGRPGRKNGAKAFGDLDPRPLIGGDGSSKAAPTGAMNLDPRPLIGGDALQPSFWHTKTKFRPTPPHRGRPLWHGQQSPGKGI